MTRIARLFCLVLLGAAAPAFAGSDLNVVVQDALGNRVPSAQVIAIVFSSAGPAVSATQFGTTDSTGAVHFTGAAQLADNTNYEVFASSQNFIPTIRDQYNDPNHLHVFTSGVSGSTFSVTLSSLGVSGYGEIDGDVKNGTALSLVFGNLRPNGGSYSDALAYGFLITNSAGAGKLKIFNVPFSSTNSYRFEAFDPVKNKNVSVVVDSELASYQTLISSFAGSSIVDFNSGIPPITVVSQAQQQGGAGNLSIDGVVTDTNGVITVPYIGLSFMGQFMQNSQTFTDNRWANTDTNGRFQLYGLMPGVTYYTTAYGGCNFQGVCFQGSASTAGAAGVFGTPPALPNDFLFVSSQTTQVLNVKLPRASGGTGTVAVYVKSNGNPLFNSWVSVYPDNMGWETSGSCAGGQFRNNPGLANVNVQASTGYVVINNLPAGNYQISAGNPFSQSGQQVTLNSGPNGQPCWANNSCFCGTDDLRVTIDTTTANSVDVRVFNSSGVAVDQFGTPAGGPIAFSSLTVNIPLTTSGSGVLKGTLTFPGVVDLSNDPITITVQPNCSFGGPCGGGGFSFFNASSTGPVISYAINIASGQSYWLNVVSNYWGWVKGGGDQSQIDLTSSSLVTVNMTFQRAGRLVGKLYKPDGSVFLPSNSFNGSYAWINASAEGNGWGGGNVNQDGSYTIGGLLPGDYGIRISGSGNGFTYANAIPNPRATIVAQQDTYADTYMKAGTAVRVDVTTTSLPPLALASCPPTSHDCPPEDWVAFALPHGTVIDQDLAKKFITHDESVLRFAFLPNPNLQSECDGRPSQPGFCVQRLPSPGLYDFHLMRFGNFDDSNLVGNWPYFTVLNSSRNVVVNDQLATTNYFFSMSTQTVEPLNLTPVPSQGSQAQATIRGSVTGSNVFRQQDFSALGGSFNNFLKYIPLVTLNDANGGIKAFGMVVPNPACFKQNLTIGATTQVVDAWFNQAIASSDFNLFNQAMGSCSGGFSYEIRGVSTGTYTVVATTPNYPPYQKTGVQLLVANSTTTLDINFDASVGQGATLSGVVTSTSGVALANASVTLEAAGYPKRSFLTDSSGAYSVAGLPAGAYAVKFVAVGYALTNVDVDVNGSGSFTANASLQAAGASISGTVYASKVPFVQVYPGADIIAYNDTLNVNNPNADLPLYHAVTSTAGYYRLDGLEVGKVYKVYVKAPGKYILNQSTLTVAGVVSGIDFTLLNKPLTVQVFGHPNGATYDFKILNPSDFKSGRAWINAGTVFSSAAATEVTQRFVSLPDNDLLLQYPTASLIAGIDYVLHIEAVSLAGANVSKDILFGTSRKASTAEDIDEALLGDDSDNAQGRPGNEAAIDESGGDSSGVGLPTGALIPTSTNAVPSVQLTSLDINAASAAAVVGVVSDSSGTFASNIYLLTLSSINYTAKGIDLSIAYNKTNSSLDDVAIYHFNPGTNQWESVPGLQTLDPVKGTLKIRRVKSLASVLGLRNGHPLLAQSDGKGYSPSAQASRGLIPDDTGYFAILRPSLVGTAFAGTTIKVFNFPNPFNLSAKTVTAVNAGGASVTTNGTVIKYELPSGRSGHVIIRIYTLAGELVKEIDQGDQQGGFYYYTAWDGTNRRGSTVANGVYYGVLSAPGTKVKDATFKLAVIK